MAATDPLGVKRCTAWLQCCSVFILKVKFKGRSVWVKKTDSCIHISQPAWKFSYHVVVAVFQKHSYSWHKDWERICKYFVSRCLEPTSEPVASLGSLQTLLRRAHQDRGSTLWLVENQENAAHSCAEIKASKTWKAKDLSAWKRVIYSWPLDSPFQMLDHVKQSISITCAGAFMGLHPLLLIYIS